MCPAFTLAFVRKMLTGPGISDRMLPGSFQNLPEAVLQKAVPEAGRRQNGQTKC